MKPTASFYRLYRLPVPRIFPLTEEVLRRTLLSLLRTFSKTVPAPNWRDLGGIHEPNTKSPRLRRAVDAGGDRAAERRCAHKAIRVDDVAGGPTDIGMQRRHTLHAQP